MSFKLRPVRNTRSLMDSLNVTFRRLKSCFLKCLRMASLYGRPWVRIDPPRYPALWRALQFYFKVAISVVLCRSFRHHFNPQWSLLLLFVKGCCVVNKKLHLVSPGQLTFLPPMAVGQLVRTLIEDKWLLYKYLFHNFFFASAVWLFR